MSAAAGLLVAIAGLFFCPILPDFVAAKAHVAGLLLAALLAVETIRTVRSGLPPRVPFAAPLFALALAFGASLLSAPNRHEGTQSLLALGGGMLLAGAIRPTGRGTRAFFSAVLATALLVSAYGILQRFGIDLPGVRRVYDSARYPVSTFGNTNYATEFVVPCVAAAAALAGLAPRRIGVGLLLLGPLYAGIAGTRAGMIALAVALAFLLAKERRLRLLHLAPLALLAAGYLGLRPSAAAPPPAAAAPAPSAAVPASFEVRWRIARSTLAMLADRPVFGVGAGNFAIAFPIYRDPEEIRISTENFTAPFESEVETAHDDPLQLLAETGLAGGAALLFLAVALARAILRAKGPAALAASTALVAVAANSLFRSPLLDNPPTLLLSFGLLPFLAPRSATPERSSPAVRLGGVLSIPLLAIAAYASARGLAADFALADAYRSGFTDRAALERAHRLAPRDGRISSWLARDLDGRDPRDPARALHLFDLALRLRPNDPAALENRGILHAKEGRLEAARADLERARDLNPLHPRIRANLEELERLERDRGSRRG